MTQKYIGPLICSFLFFGFSCFLIISGSLKLSYYKLVYGTVNGYDYTNKTCIVCQSVFHGYPTCEVYEHSGAVLLTFNNCMATIPVNICGGTPESAIRNTKELYKIGSQLEGYRHNCYFHFLRSDGWQFIGLGVAFFIVFMVLLCIGLFFLRKHRRTISGLSSSYISYQSLH